jgi:hypothetical protein
MTFILFRLLLLYTLFFQSCQSFPQLPIGTWINSTIVGSSESFSVTIPNNDTSLRFRLIGAPQTDPTHSITVTVLRQGQHVLLAGLVSYGWDVPTNTMTCPESVYEGNYTVTFKSLYSGNYTFYAEYVNVNLPSNSTCVESWSGGCITSIVTQYTSGSIFRFTTTDVTSSASFFLYLINSTTVDPYLPDSSQGQLSVYISKDVCPDPANNVYDAVINTRGDTNIITLNSSTVPGISDHPIYILIVEEYVDFQCNTKRSFEFGYCRGDGCIVKNPVNYQTSGASSSTTGSGIITKEPKISLAILTPRYVLLTIIVSILTMF